MPRLLPHHFLDNPHEGSFMLAQTGAALRLRVGLTRVTPGIAVSWTLLVMVAVRRITLAVTMRWLVVLPPIWNSLGDC
jgi:hypothetical protein